MSSSERKTGISPSSRGRTATRSGAVVVVLGGTLVIVGDASPALAAPFEVTNTSGLVGDVGSLPWAIDEANATAALDTVTFATGVTGVIDLGAESLKITEPVQIIGPGSSELTITNSSGGLLYVYGLTGVSLTLKGVTLADAAADAIAGTGVADLDLIDVVIEDPVGAGIVGSSSVAKTITLSDVTITDPTNGMVLAGTSSATFTDVSVSGATGVGVNLKRTGVGGISPLDATLTRVDIDGGTVGVRLYYAAAIELTDVTVSGASAEGVWATGTYSAPFDAALTRVDVDGGTTGVRLEYATVELTDVTVSMATSIGLSLSDGPSGGAIGDSTATRLDISDSGTTGLWLTSSLDLIDSVITRSGGSGMFLSSSNPSTPRDLHIERSTIDGFSKQGIRAIAVGEVSISNSTITGGIGSDPLLGPIEVDGPSGGPNASLNIVNSSIVDNLVSGDAISVSYVDLEMRHTTVSGNTRSTGTGSVVELSNSSATVDHSVITGNSGLQAFSIGTGTTAGASNSAVPIGSALGASNVETDAPGLEPLADNGGPTQTRLPVAGSPLLDGGNAAIVSPPTADQRGAARVVGDRIDIGAVEVDAGTISIADASIAENGGNASVVLTRSGGTDGVASVALSTVAGTATAPGDFTAIVSQTVAFANGEGGTKSLAVSIVDDDDFEGDEAFDVVASAPIGAALGTSTATVTITDDDSEPDPDPDPDPGPSGGQLVIPAAPGRFADTRSTGETIDDESKGAGKLGAGDELMVQIAGRGVVPADAVGVVMNVTAIGAEGVGFVTAHPCVEPRPVTSSLNFSAGVNLGNEIVAGLSSDGEVCLFTSAAAHLAIDVVGYIPAGSPLVNITPKRVLDTRTTGVTTDGEGLGDGKTGAGDTTTLRVAGRAGVPADAAAVLVNVTAVGATQTGFVTVSPCVLPTPTASSLNYVAGVNRGNELLASLDDDGEICLFTSSSVHLTADVVGYVPAGSDYTAVDPARLLDTRDNGQTVDGDDQRTGKRAGGSQYQLSVADRAGVPNGASAVVVNVTAIQAESIGFVTAHPCLEPRPLASSLNYVPGVNGGNEIIASLSAEGEICLFTSAAAHLTVDVVGYINN